RFFKRLIIGASLFAGCSLVTQLLLAESIPLPLILTGLTLVLGCVCRCRNAHDRHKVSREKAGSPDNAGWRWRRTNNHVYLRLRP
ncbi:YccS/YhfK family membrane protein, partial [Salmonella enterica subsp. enterica serovar Cerro]|nr:YccS/YhfK family membrane protein [Salmonella enterica subsp. enterica serovar Cerro]